MLSDIDLSAGCIFIFMIRAFISVDVPVTEELRSVSESLKKIDSVRVTPENQLHLTLKFLGDTDEKKVERLCSELRRSLEGTEPFDVVIRGSGAFPNQRNPRVLWLGVKDPERLVDTADIVDSTVKGLKIRTDDKKFSPHLTVGRLNGKCDLKDFFKDNDEKTFCSFRCDHIDVMKSVLTPKGAIHSVISRIELN